MIKRILVALDPDQDTPVATRYAAQIAGRSDAQVHGLAIIDTARIAAEIGPGGAVGTLHYIEDSRRRMVDEAREVARTLVNSFDAALDDARVAHEEHVKEGSPVEEVLGELRYSDLLVLGRTPHFFYNRPERKTNTLARIVKKSVAPSLIVCETFQPVEHVLVAYDGSDASARTMQRFAQLKPFGTDLIVEVLHVRTGDAIRKPGISDALLEGASRYLGAHGFDRIRTSGVKGEKPAPILMDYAASMNADLIIAGAHSVSAVRRAAFGSTTHELLSTCSVPMFVFH